ncbi:MAG: V-type ATPase subunit, partial [Promethearchaeota archaeon]
MSIIIPSYAYTFIKIDYLKNLIIDPETLRKFKTIYNIESFIETIRPYYPNLEIKEFTIENIEIALLDHYIRLVGKILNFSPQNMRIFLQSYLLKFEIQNLKQIVIGLILGIDYEEKRKNVNFLVETYLDNTEFIEEMLKLTNLDEIQLFLKIREGLLYYIKKKEIFVLEAFLDQLYYTRLRDQVKRLNKKEEIMISLLVKYKTEVYNLNVIYRGI